MIGKTIFTVTTGLPGRQAPFRTPVVSGSPSFCTEDETPQSLLLRDCFKPQAQVPLVLGVSVTPNSVELTSEPMCGKSLSRFDFTGPSRIPYGDAPKLIPLTCYIALASMESHHIATRPALLALPYWALLTSMPGTVIFWRHIVGLEQGLVHSETQSPACSPMKVTTKNVLLAKILVFTHHFKNPNTDPYNY